jgi:hypothetical protein
MTRIVTTLDRDGRITGTSLSHYQARERRGEGQPETFTFLGFTHYCGKRRSNGTFTIWRKTASRLLTLVHSYERL